MKPIRYFSMFSGIGGFEVGLLNSKYEFECVGHSEVDNFAKAIYTRHFPDHKNFGDATKIVTKDLPDFELLVGGFPCQAFSVAGKRGGFEDIRGTLFFELARVLKDKKPKYFLFENVKGLLSHEEGKTFTKILETLDELRYNVSWEIYNSKDYDVPQNRERLFIKGYLRGTSGGKILFKPRIGTEVNDDRKVSGKWYGTHRTGRIHNTGGILNCLSTTGQNGGRSQLIRHKIPRKVMKRKHEWDIQELQGLLRDSKEKTGITIRSISGELDVPQTQVEHWFRVDDYFSIPPSNVWFDLKKLLEINTTAFDDFVTEFEVVDGVYDMSKRAYDDKGMSPTLNTCEDTLIKLGDERSVNELTANKSSAQRVYDADGLATTLKANGGGQGGKTGLYQIKK